ncbi:MAG: hypothetical protein QHC40_04700 [Sphingobium sp.]|nr:hypothetical protein [Sphingobium sp.]
MSNIAILRQAIIGLREAVPQISSQLRAAEHDADLFLSSTAKLLSIVVESRMTTNLSAAVGQDVIDNISHALSSAADSRRSLVEAHNRLAAIGEKFGLDISAYGGGEGKENP